MNDCDIIDLYWERDGRAIKETSEKYGSFCKSIAMNILSSEEDASECVNDTYFSAWNSIPPQRPEKLAAYLGKITRNLSFNRYKHDRVQKRGGGNITLVLDELAECVSDADSVEKAMDRQELASALNSFVKGLSSGKRIIFVQRYWYGQTVKEIAADSGLSENNVSKTLERQRRKLRAYLKERGFEI